MTNLVTLFAAVALATYLSSTVYAQIGGSNTDMDNRLLPNEIPIMVPKPRRRAVGKYIKITSPPPETVNFMPGTSLVLECVITGNPAPVAAWMKNGVLVSDIEEESNEIFAAPELSPAELSSKHVIRAASNGDVFTCIARSGMRKESASTTVYVEDDSASLLEATQTLPSKPIITTSYNDLMQTIGTSVTLPCRVYSNMKSQIFWIDNTGKVIYGNSRFRVLPSGDLYITGLSWKDMGGWTCAVKNPLGKDAAETFIYPLMTKST